MEFRLLGEVELLAAGEMLDVGTPRLQAVLAALAVDAGRPVAVETLIDRVWADTPPAEARNALYSYLSRVRRMLRQAAALTGETTVRIDRRYAGYVLDIAPDLVDLHRFRRLVDEDGDRRCDDAARTAALAEALDLWRGAPLAGVPGKWAAQVRESCDRRRLDAVVRWAQIELRLGHPAALIATLPDLAAEYPLVEPIEALLMRALHAAGRSAEALDRYTAVRQRLADELGTDPGSELRAIHAAILHGMPPAADPATAAARTAPPPRPRLVLPASAPTEHEPDRTEKPPRRTDAVAPDAPPTPAQPRPTRRRAVLAALAALVLTMTIGSAHVFRQDKDDDLPSASPSLERARTLFATAGKFHQEGRTEDARTTTVNAVRLYDELIKLDPEQNAPTLAPVIIQALGRVGVDFSVAEPAMRSWLANPEFTPYPAISQTILLQGWRLRTPVYLDVIVWNYEHAAGTSPRKHTEVQPDALKAAFLEASNSRYGTGVTDFEQLLGP